MGGCMRHSLFKGGGGRGRRGTRCRTVGGVLEKWSRWRERDPALTLSCQATFGLPASTRVPLSARTSQELLDELLEADPAPAAAAAAAAGAGAAPGDQLSLVGAGEGSRRGGMAAPALTLHTVSHFVNTSNQKVFPFVPVTMRACGYQVRLGAVVHWWGMGLRLCAARGCNSRAHDHNRPPSQSLTRPHTPPRPRLHVPSASRRRAAARWCPA